MRQPTVQNKYNLTVAKLKELKAELDKNTKYKVNSWVITAVVVIAVILVNLIVTTISSKALSSNETLTDEIVNGKLKLVTDVWDTRKAKPVLKQTRDLQIFKNRYGWV